MLVETQNNLPKRKRPAHVPPVLRHNEPIVLFITVCSKDGQLVFADKTVHAALVNEWRNARSWLVGDYVVMPDHIHAFCVQGVHVPESVQKWARFWKQNMSRKLHELCGKWQKDCWDTQMRNVSHYNEKLAYVRQNPVRRGLVARAEDWPFSGRLFEIRW